jgi:TonB-linked SusC/RagA family outer membrane protein
MEKSIMKSRYVETRDNFKKLLLIMKLSTLFLITGAFSLFAGSSYSQSTKVTLHLKNVKIEDVLNEIENKSEFYFLFNQKLVDVDRKVDIAAENRPIKDILAEIFDKSNVKYIVLDRQIILTTRENSGAFNEIKQQTISGTVTDVTTGELLQGVSILIEGTTTGAITDAKGQYSISVPNPNAVLVFSFIGYLTEKVVVLNQTTIDIKLSPDIKKLEELVVVGYGMQKKGNLTGSVASVKSDELTVAPVASTVNTLAGRLPGLISVQSTGKPGSDQAALSIRGFGEAIWIVDGVETNFNIIDQNQIESISILKDGSASIYGARAGNGVILVTTKRGNNHKPTFSVNSSYTLQGITAMAHPVNAGQYCEIENEKRTNQGLEPIYSQEQIQKYYSGTDPQYPNTDWFKETINKWAPEQQHNISIRGGSDKIKYYGFFGYLDQETFWKKNGGNYDRYNLQSNIDAKITDNLSIQLDLSAVVENSIFSLRPQDAGTNSLWQDLWNSLPIYPASLPDPTKYSYANGQGVGSIKLSSNYDIYGYNKSNKQNLKGTFVLNYKIPQIKGLSAKAFVNYLQSESNSKEFTKPYSFYTYDAVNNVYSLAGSLGTQAQLYEYRNGAKTITGQLSLNYDNTFGTKHHFTALALYECINYTKDYLAAGREGFLTSAIDQLFVGSSDKSFADGSESENGRASYVGRINYSYSEKYLMEATIRADASAAFSSQNRWGYFPSVSLGWRLNQEVFMKNISAIDELKIRASYGSSGLDDVGLFQYLSGYKLDGYWLFGNSTEKGIVSTGLSNPDLTWETIKIYNLGTDFSFWNRKLFGTAEVFYRALEGIPATRNGSLPSTFGASLPQENLNSQNSRGFEFSLGTRGNLNGFNYEINGNISWSRSKWDHYEEQEYTDPDQIRINKKSGKWTDIWIGYKSDGLFTSQDEISNLKFTYPSGNAGLKPGDIKYVDVNNDGKLDWRDQVEIGKGTTPHWMVGGTINLKYKDFDLSSLLQGAFGYSNYIQLQHGGINYSRTLYKLRWSEKNNSAGAFEPRLGGASTNTSITSDHFFKKTAYVRLKTLSIGYNVPPKIIGKYKIERLRIYFAGTNLLTYNKLKDFDVDPEAPSSNAAYYYPQQRTISMGANLSF